ncbi:MAG: hypothetical protein H6868_02240 [Rhodospirillales bacterium]|nr:hypothetical protein [Rhodospirillales bacterium]
MGHFSFIDKSYKLLFLIYAPVALATLALKFFSGIEISYIFLAAIAFVIVSTMIALLVVVQFFRHFEDVKKDRELHIPYTLRHQFLIAFIAISATTFLIAGSYGYFVYRITDGKGFPQMIPGEKIVFLTGIKDPIGNKIEGFDTIMAGINHFIEETPDKTGLYHFSYIDHHDAYDEGFKLAVQQKIKEGAHYFICTSSDPCKALTADFPSLAGKNADGPADARLIITTASLSTIQTQKDLIYKFSVNNHDQGDLLAKTAYESGARKIAFIATDDEYGHDAVQNFESAWQEFSDIEGIQGVFIDKKLSADKVTERLAESFLIKNSYDSILIAGNGREINFLNSQESIRDMPLYVFSESSYTLIDGLENPSRMTTIRPRYRDSMPGLSGRMDTMVYMTLEKLIHSIELAKSSEDSFDSVWGDTSYPALVEFEKEGDADFKILLQIYKPTVDSDDLDLPDQDDR